MMKLNLMVWLQILKHRIDLALMTTRLICGISPLIAKCFCLVHVMHFADALFYLTAIVWQVSVR